MTVSYCDQGKEPTVVKHGDTSSEDIYKVEQFSLHQEGSNSYMQDDKIVSVKVRCGMLIDQLEFHTRDGRVHGPYGGQGGDPHIESAKDHGQKFEYLSHISGTEVDTKPGMNIIKLKFHWA